jgi:hypothetical protein
MFFSALSSGFGQGLVNFINTPQTLISADTPGNPGIPSAITGAPGSYYFGLLTADNGPADLSRFTFSGVYATNLSSPGRINGGRAIPIPGWAPGTAKWFMVCGWPASAGHTFNPAWLYDGNVNQFGVSPAVRGIAGGFDEQTGANLTALDIFGINTIYTGFNIRDEICLSCDDPPWIMLQPQDKSATAGMTVQFVVGALPTSGLRCQWLCNEVAISTATGFTLELTNVDLSQNGNRYYAIVSNPRGSAQSTNATLTVTEGIPLDVQWIPGLRISGPEGTSLEIKHCDGMGGSASWSSLQALSLTTTQQWWFDLSGSVTQRFYRTASGEIPASNPVLDLSLVPTIALTGMIGGQVQLDYVKESQPTGTPVALATVLLTNSTQLYFDISAIGQPPRLYWSFPR